MGKRGRKTCPECTTETGARTILCNCGYHFPTKEMRKDLLKEKKNHPVKKDGKTAGQGKKFCPSCTKKIGVRTSLCKCGYHFPSKKVRKDLLEEKKNSSVNKENKIYDKEGKGRKRCPGCNIIVGGILKTCFKCNFDFVAAKKEKEEQKEKERQEKRAARAEIKRIKKEEKEKKRIERYDRISEELETKKTHPEVKKLMEDEGLLEKCDEIMSKMGDLSIDGAPYFTADEHADRILREYGPNRIKNLLRQARNMKCWRYINWDKVEEGLKERV